MNHAARLTGSVFHASKRRSQDLARLCDLVADALRELVERDEE
jgi:hypothetical protein